MTRAKAKNIHWVGTPWKPSGNRHPLAKQPPPADGTYWVKGFPGDDERLLRWSHGGFRLGAAQQMFYSWRKADEADAPKGE